MANLPIDTDTFHASMMRRAIANGTTARLRSRPNPWVGAVLVDRYGALYDGATQLPGSDHAEKDAIAAAIAAGADIDGATLFTTLEPCNHTGRTGPCTDAIIEAGIGRVIVGITDPDPQVAGSGLTRLKDAGSTSRSASNLKPFECSSPPISRIALPGAPTLFSSSP